MKVQATGDEGFSKEDVQLSALKTEFNTFNLIIADEYRELSRQSYLLLEQIAVTEGNALSHSGRANLRRVQACIQKIAIMSDDLRTFSELTETDTRLMDISLTELVNTIVSGYPAKNNIQVTSNFLPGIKAYPSLLALLFRQLIAVITRLARLRQPCPIAITYSEAVYGKSLSEQLLLPATDYHVITISSLASPADTTENIVSFVETLHKSGKTPGTSAGLAMSNAIAGLHGGIIKVQYLEGEGTAFQCLFPSVKAA